MWLLGAAGAYVLALLSKETATLLPLVLLFTPRPRCTYRSQVFAVIVLCGLGVAIYAWRAHVGAATPFSADAHYKLLTGVSRLGRSLQNYTGRMIVAPMILIVLISVSALLRRQHRNPANSPAAGGTYPIEAGELIFSLVWVLVFLAPVLPIVARSELYLYLPVAGFCFAAGDLASALVRNLPDRRVVATMVACYVIILGTYQIARAREIHRQLVFSERFLVALINSREVARHQGGVLLIPLMRRQKGFFATPWVGISPWSSSMPSAAHK